MDVGLVVRGRPSGPPNNTGEPIETVAVPFVAFESGWLGGCIGIRLAALSSVTQILSCADEALSAAKRAGPSCGGGIRS